MSEAPRQTWFITGSSSGFGRHLTELLLERGDRVAATVRNPDSLKDLAGRYGERLWVRKLDVTDNQQVAKVVDEAFATLGRVDVIVSNAGYALFGAAEEMTQEQIEHQLDTNLVGSINVIRFATRHLRAQGGGKILQVSSVGGQVAFPALSLYHASKWGIEGFVESLVGELAPFGIQLTLVEPGSAGTDFGSRSAVVTQPIEAYESGPVGRTRKSIAGGGSPAKGDARKMAAAMIAIADRETLPRRLTLGGDAYKYMRAALQQRLADLEAQEALAHSTDL
jgi:NAD(P)-dependent dehydrogenase (short-subunit alcohol dehydrogenase family)